MTIIHTTLSIMHRCSSYFTSESHKILWKKRQFSYFDIWKSKILHLSVIFLTETHQYIRRRAETAVIMLWFEFSEHIFHDHTSTRYPLNPSGHKHFNNRFDKLIEFIYRSTSKCINKAQLSISLHFNVLRCCKTTQDSRLHKLQIQ